MDQSRFLPVLHFVVQLPISSKYKIPLSLLTWTWNIFPHIDIRIIRNQIKFPEQTSRELKCRTRVQQYGGAAFYSQSIDIFELNKSTYLNM